MSIEFRRGNSDKFDKNKMKTGEPAVVLDTKEFYVTFGPGDVQRMVTYDNALDIIQNATQDIIADLTEAIDIAIGDMETHIDQYLANITVQINALITATNEKGNWAKTQGDYAKTQGDYAKIQGEYAKLKGDEAKAIVDSASPIINTNLQATYKDKLTDAEGKFITCPTADDGLTHVKKIVGETVQKTSVQGKNICPSQFEYWESGQYSAEDGSKEPKATRIRLKNLLPVLPNTTYYTRTFSANNALPFVVRAYDKNKVFTRNIGIVGDIDLVTRENEFYIGVMIIDNTDYAKFKTDFESGAIKPFICLNSETNKAYEPFTPNSPSPEYPSPLEYAKEFDVYTSGKNLIPYPYKDGTATKNGITFIVNTDGSVTANGTATARAQFIITNIPTTVSWTNPLRLSGCPSGGGNSSYQLFMSYVRDGETYPSYYLDQGNGVTISSLKRYSSIVIDIMSGVVANNLVFKPQLEFGTVQTTYELPKRDKKSISFPFMSVPDGIKNELSYDVSGKFTSRTRVREIELTGTENWVISASATSTIGSFALRVDDAINSYDNTKVRAMSTHFKAGTMQDTASPTIKPNYVSLDHGAINRFIRITSDKLFTVWDLKTWLVQQKANGTPVKVQYAIKDVIVEEFDPLYLKSYKGITHIFTNSSPQVTLTADFKSELWSNEYLLNEKIVDPSTLVYMGKDSIGSLPMLQDADLLGGKNKAYFEGLISTVDNKIPLKANIVQNVTGKNANNLFSEGTYFGYGYDIVNAPDNGAYNIISTPYTGALANDYGSQILIPVDVTTKPVKYRIKTNGVWSSWNHLGGGYVNVPIEISGVLTLTQGICRIKDNRVTLSMRFTSPNPYTASLYVGKVSAIPTTVYPTIIFRSANGKIITGWINFNGEIYMLPSASNPVSSNDEFYMTVTYDI